jgi:hypothetical protein
MASERPIDAHKFKVGDVVNYRPADRYLRRLRGAYTITRALPGTGQPEYRIRRANEEHERAVKESELSEA